MRKGKDMVLETSHLEIMLDGDWLNSSLLSLRPAQPNSTRIIVPLFVGRAGRAGALSGDGWIMSWAGTTSSLDLLPQRGAFS
jgi:hypothetical protein